LFQEEHARASLEIIEKANVFACELVCDGRGWPNLYPLPARSRRQCR
jgi:hypothetical protein